MLSNNQLRSIQLKAKIVSDLLNDETFYIEDVKEMFAADNTLSEVLQIDELFKMLIDVIRGSNKQMPKNVDIKNVFKQLCPEDHDCSDFLYNFLNFLINDSSEKEIQIRLEELKNLDYTSALQGSEVHKLYLYNVLSLALVCHPLDLEFIKRMNEELILLNNDNN